MLVSKVGGGTWTKDHIKVDSVVYHTLSLSPPIPQQDSGGEIRFVLLRNMPQTEYQHLSAHHEDHQLSHHTLHHLQML